jgi:hypothetical protein
MIFPGTMCSDFGPSQGDGLQSIAANTLENAMMKSRAPVQIFKRLTTVIPRCCIQSPTVVRFDYSPCHCPRADDSDTQDSVVIIRSSLLSRANDTISS